MRGHRSFEINGASIHRDPVIRLVRWIARSVGVGLLLLAVVLAIGGGAPNPMHLSGTESACTIWFLIMLIGTALAWRWEGVGSALVLIGFAFFWGANTVSNQRLSLGWVLLLFPIVALLQLFCWYRSKLAENKE